MEALELIPDKPEEDLANVWGPSSRASRFVMDLLALFALRALVDADKIGSVRQDHFVSTVEALEAFSENREPSRDLTELREVAEWASETKEISVIEARLVLLGL